MTIRESRKFQLSCQEQSNGDALQGVSYIATVDGNGKVTAVSEGTATITAYLLHKGGNKKTCTVTVMSSTGINTPLVDKNSHQAYYDLSGNKLLVPQKGLIIVKYKNGKTKTVLIK